MMELVKNHRYPVTRAEIIEIIEVPEEYQDEYDSTFKRIRSKWKI